MTEVHCSSTITGLETELKQRQIGSRSSAWGQSPEDGGARGSEGLEGVRGGSRAWRGSVVRGREGSKGLEGLEGLEGYEGYEGVRAVGRGGAKLLGVNLGCLSTACAVKVYDMWKRLCSNSAHHERG